MVSPTGVFSDNRKRGKKQPDKKIPRRFKFGEVKDFSINTLIADFITNRKFKLAVKYSFIGEKIIDDISLIQFFNNELASEYYKRRRAKKDLSPLILYPVWLDRFDRLLIFDIDGIITQGEKMEKFIHKLFNKYFK